jgi:hypothetical protein
VACFGRAVSSRASEGMQHCLSHQVVGCLDAALPEGMRQNWKRHAGRVHAEARNTVHPEGNRAIALIITTAVPTPASSK